MIPSTGYECAVKRIVCSTRASFEPLVRLVASIISPVCLFARPSPVILWLCHEPSIVVSVARWAWRVPGRILRTIMAHIAPRTGAWVVWLVDETLLSSILHSSSGVYRSRCLLSERILLIAVWRWSNLGGCRVSSSRDLRPFRRRWP